MNEPIKIIHKYKNYNRKIQYNVLIFIGNLLSDTTNKVLKKIQDKSLYETLTEINDRDINILNKEYGNKWYKYFFIDKHIQFTFNKIIKSNELKKEIIQKYGGEWYSSHIDSYLEISKIIYSYQTIFKDNKNYKIKNDKRIKNMKEITYKINSSDINIDGGYIFTGSTMHNNTNNNNNDNNNNNLITTDNFIQQVANRINLEHSVSQIIYNKNLADKQENNSDSNSENNSDDKINLNIDMIGGVNNDTSDNNYTNDHNNEVTIDVNSIDEIDMNDLENIKIGDVVFDKNVDQINKSIQQFIDKTDIEEKNTKYSNITNWNDTKDKIMYDEDIINVYSKTYIYNQYICADDTIKNIKNKISCGYGKSTVFDNNTPYFISSRLYLWSEYSYFDINNKFNTDKIMLGQKWVSRNELLELDVEPNDNIYYYEILKGNLKNLQQNIKKYSSKITHENDEENILLDYLDFMTNNEIYMSDIYNSLGIKYQPSSENLNNLYDVYVKIYFPSISQSDLKNIINYLNLHSTSDKKTAEEIKILLTYKNIQNDLLMENEILKTIEEIKKTPSKYIGIFKDNYITQSVIHINIKHQNFKDMQTIELYRIFDNFIVSDKYPFIQFQTPDGKLVFKYYSQSLEVDRDNIISKWFENTPYGISFKINMDKTGGLHSKYISISLNENARMDYKTQWKEDDHATIDDIKKTYNEIRELLKKINRENNKLKVEIPDDHRFRFAFINTIQQLELPDKYMISHNDLSDFARYFYPYIGVVIEPRKRQSKILKKNEKSKYGTYLRYKKISKYENEANLEKRILYFLRNYEFNEQLLSLEISKQFNITDKQASELIKSVIAKYPNLKKSRNVLKKLENIPKYKPPGIGIDIQGKNRTNYKMRISGARSKKQLDDIINFMNILIYLYIETYLYKNKDRLELKTKLKSLVNIAKRRNKVDDIIEVGEVTNTVKQITKLDKERLAYKPEKGQNQWTRNCQNSGNKRRRPTPYTDKNIDTLIKSGYELNKETGDYEKNIMIKKKQVTLKAAKIDNYDQQGNSIYYTCDPKDNGEYMHIGFLSRSANPYGLCMPCCFKKDPGTSNNKEKKEYHLRCLGKLQTEMKSKKLIGDKLYILHNSNKIQDGRFGYLPDYLDIYLNTLLNKDKIIKNNYLINSNNGYFFIYGSKQDDNIFLTAICDVLDISTQLIRDKITQVLLKSDNANAIFTSLNNGDIKTQFANIKSYLRFLQTNFEIEYDLIVDILSVPGIVYEYGINIIIFEKKTQFVQNKSEKILKDDYNIIYHNLENLHYLTDPNKMNIILIKDEFNYYPIYEVKKLENSKNIDVNKYFLYSNKKNNVIKHMVEYIQINNNKINVDIKIDDVKQMFIKLEKYGLTKYYPTKQIIDKRNKCKYFVIQDKYIIPVKPSGALFWIPIEENYENYITDLKTISNILYDIYISSDKNILVKPYGIYYTDKTNRKYTINALIIDKNINIPIEEIILNEDEVITYAKKYKIKNFLTESKSIYDIIDKELINYDFKTQFIDNRILEVNKHIFYEEGYDLFRLELAYYLNNQHILRNKIIQLLNNQNIEKIDKKKKIKKILYKIINKQLYDIFVKKEHELINEFENIKITSQNDASNQNTPSDDNLSDHLDDMDLLPINISEILNSDLIDGDLIDDERSDDERRTDNEKKIDKKKNIVRRADKKKEGKQKEGKQPEGEQKINLVVSDNKIPLLSNEENEEINNLHMFVNTHNKFVHVNDKEDKMKIKNNIINYKKSNIREICPINQKNRCNINPHCQWRVNSCLFKTTSTQIIKYINRVIEELVNNELKSNEILSIDNYFVSDIVNKDYYTNRDNQKIIKSNNNNIKKILSELFGNNNIPIIGKRKLIKIFKNINEDNIQNPIEFVGNTYYQLIHPSIIIYRAIANALFWQKNPILNVMHRNLGFYNPVQTNLANYFKSKVIDWITNKKNQDLLLLDLSKITDINKDNFINDFKQYLTKSNEILKCYIYDIYILSKIIDIPIVLYNNFDTIIGIFDNGIQYLSNYLEYSDTHKYLNNKLSLNIKYDISNFSLTNTPNNITVIYSK